MSEPIRAGQAHLTAFVLVDPLGVEVTGLGTAFVVAVSKNGGAFAASTGTKTEIGSGWYTYELTAAETDTVGPLAIKITHASIEQQNLLFEVNWAAWAAPAGTYILSATEASDVLRCDIADPNMLALLPAIDAYIEMATGRDWAADTAIRQEAKNAARMLLVMWHENPGMMASGQTSLNFGLSACLVQLEALALELESEGVPDETTALKASLPADGADGIAIDANLILIFNHPMAAGATSAVVLKDSAGSTVASSNTLDVTAKILTINPTGSLTAASRYSIVITAAPDVYGLTLTKTIQFTTA